MAPPEPASPGRETAARGRALLAERIAAAPDLVAGLPALQPDLKRLLTPGAQGPRCLVSTGIGTSEGHARHFAEVASRCFGWPARFASTASLQHAPPPASSRDWLVVFSQGLSANARHALQHLDAWGGCILVTGLHPDTSEAEGLSEEKRTWLAALEARGVVRVDLGCGAEYGSLLRVIGARAGYVAGWSILRTLAHARLEAAAALDLDVEALRTAQRDAPRRAAEAFPESRPLADFFEAGRPLLLLADEGVADFVDHLSLKLAEGMLRPQPRMLDALQFAHGPLQSIAARPASILYLTSSGGDASAGRDAWLERLRATLDPRLHDLRVLRGTLPWPIAAVEFEAIFDHLVARSLEETGADVVAWPGAAREDALYAVGPEAPEAGETARVPPAVAWEARVWPEMDALITGGRRTALVGLGSIEQHGPHLPLGTDRWIADALLAGLEARLDDAVALPAIPVGCASEHLDFAGTLHVEPETLEAMLRDVLRSLARHGFERAFLFTAHGGNLDALEAMGERLAASVAPLVLRVEMDPRVGAMQSAVVEAASLSASAAGPHAGEYETSVVAHLRPGTIRTEALVPGRIVVPGEAQGLFYPSLRPNAETGVLGDPSSAAAERGAGYLEAWIELLADAYRDAFGGTAALATVGATEKNRA